MPCPHCAATATTEQARRTALGYRPFRCRASRRVFNERTAPRQLPAVPTEVVLRAALRPLRDTLSLRDRTEMSLPRGVVFTHEAVREWGARFAPLLTARLHAKRRGRAGRSWYVDETYIKVTGA